MIAALLLALSHAAAPEKQQPWKARKQQQHWAGLRVAILWRGMHYGAQAAGAVSFSRRRRVAAIDAGAGESARVSAETSSSSRRRRGGDPDRPWMNRGAAADASRIVRRPRVAATPRVPRG